MADLDDLLARAWRAYRRDEHPHAIALAQQAVEVAGDDGRAWHVLACACERAGDLREADRAFRRAAAAPHEAQPAPWRVPWRRFEQAVAAARERLPPAMRRHLDAVTLGLEEYPRDEHIEGDDPEILGVHLGPTRADLLDPGLADGEPSRILLFRRPHEHACTSQAEFDDEVARTLYHEFAHHLGFDEGDMPGMDLD